MEERDCGKAALELTEIRVTGLTEAQEKNARALSRVGFRCLEGLNEVVGLSEREGFPVRVRLWVAVDFDGAVREVLGEYSKGEHASTYSSRREAVVAAGKCMFRRGDDSLEATVVLSGALWESDEPQAVYQRFYTVFHEMGHVGIEVRRDPNQPPKAAVGTVEWEFELFGQVVLEEYKADTLAELMCSGIEIAKDQDGNVLKFRDVLGNVFLETAFGLLEFLCGWVKERVHGYRLRLVELDDLFAEVYPRMNELFQVLAHLVGTNADKEGGIEECRQVLEHSAGFRTYLAEDWQAFVEAFSREEKAEAVEELKQVAMRVLHRLGIRMEDLPTGERYMHVHEPLFCDECSDA